MKIPDKLYDILKWVVIIVLPAIARIVLGLGERMSQRRNAEARGSEATTPI